MKEILSKRDCPSLEPWPSCAEEKLSVAYCGNEGVFPLILLSALSIVKYTEEPVDFYLSTMDLRDCDPRFSPISERQRKILEEAVTQKNPKSSVRVLRADEAYFATLKGGKNEGSRYTPYTLLRLLFSEFSLPDKLLYLDADTMCCSSLSKIKEFSPVGCSFCAAVDEMGKFWFRRDYFNAGVLYLNLKRIKESGLFERARELVFRKKLYFSDQTVLNRLGREEMRLMPRRFNEQRAIREDTVIKHFCRGIKWTPFFHVYNYKQCEVETLHRFHITQFDDVFETYRTLAAKHGLKELK